MLRRLLQLVVAFAVATGSAGASQLYALQGMAIGPPLDPCTFYRWDGDLLFHNVGTTDAVVRAINVSNGRLPSGVPLELPVPPGKTVALGTRWRPVPVLPPLWVIELDVPNDVVVESRIVIATEYCAGPPTGNPKRGKLSFPIFRALQPPGSIKVHLGTDLASISARNNVAIYNVGTVAANAHIEIRRGCDDALVDSRDVQIAANSVISVNGFDAPTGCDLPGTTPPSVTYVTVVVDQPSLSWVSTLANGKEISVVYGVTSSSP